jgi:nucleoside-diphosphate-sugar epimerase
MKLGLWGARGFLGQAVGRAATVAGAEVVALPRVDLSDIVDSGREPQATIESWLSNHPGDAYQFMELLSSCYAVVNAAGCADSESMDERTLTLANTVLPTLIATLTARAKTPRLVHVSSSAVQGRLDPLDETKAFQPISPYSRTKAEAERLLLEGIVERPNELAIYRPTSVQGSDRRITKALVRLAMKPIIPIVGHGEAPLPICLLENVARGIVHVALMGAPCEGIFLQTSEDMTTRLLLEAFGFSPRLISLPRPAVRAGHRAIRTVIKGSPRWEVKLRRLELLAFGQGVEGTALAKCGFSPTGGFEAYRELAERVRANDRVTAG